MEPTLKICTASYLIWALFVSCTLHTPFDLNICNTWACQATQSPSVVKKKPVAISMDNIIVKYNCNLPVFHKYFARIKSNIDTLSQLWNCHVDFYGTFEASDHSKLSLMSYHLPLIGFCHALINSQSHTTLSAHIVSTLKIPNSTSSKTPENKWTYPYANPIFVSYTLTMFRKFWQEDHPSQLQ
jgi:hypothetical protein